MVLNTCNDVTCVQGHPRMKTRLYNFNVLCTYMSSPPPRNRPVVRGARGACSPSSAKFRIFCQHDLFQKNILTEYICCPLFPSSALSPSWRQRQKKKIILKFAPPPHSRISPRACGKRNLHWHIDACHRNTMPNIVNKNLVVTSIVHKYRFWHHTIMRNVKTSWRHN